MISTDFSIFFFCSNRTKKRQPRLELSGADAASVWTFPDLDKAEPSGALFLISSASLKRSSPSELNQSTS